MFSVSASFLPPQNWNYFADTEADSVKMMEEVEKLCDRLELTRYGQLRDHHMDEFEWFRNWFEHISVDQDPKRILNLRWCRSSILWYLFVSSLQSLNEILASGSKEDSKAAVDKQVKRHFAVYVLHQLWNECEMPKKKSKTTRRPPHTYHPSKGTSVIWCVLTSEHVGVPPLRCRRWTPSCRGRGRLRSKRGRQLAALTRPAEEEEPGGRAGTRTTSSCSSKPSTCSLLEPTPGRHSHDVQHTVGWRLWPKNMAETSCADTLSQLNSSICMLE